MTPTARPTAQSRTLPRSLAPLVEALELDQARLLTTDDLDQLRQRAGITTPAKVLAARLRDHGWLLPTDRRGVYEFAPGAHAGALPRGDLTTPLQAVLRARPDLVAGLTLQSAAWALDAADRAPTRLEIAAADRASADSIATILGVQVRVMVFRPQLPMPSRRGVPVLAADSVIVHMAARPRDVRSWSSALEWLPELASDLNIDQIQRELHHRPAAVTARLGYLLSGLRPDIADQLPPTTSKVYFGGRGRLLRHDATWLIADTVLPVDPRHLPPATG